MENLFGSILILLSFIIFALLINFIFEKVLRSLVGKTKTKFDDKLIELLRKPFFYSVILLGFYISAAPLSISPSFLTFLRKILVTSAFIIWGVVAVEVFRLFFSKLEDKAESEKHKGVLPDILPFLDNLTKVGVATIVFLTILSFWGIDITPALASAGVVGVAVAFAARDTVANLFGGFSVFFDKPYKTGDYVLVEGKYRGEVIEIGMRSTKIKTRDNILLTVPNSVMITNTVINETGFDPKLRIRIPLGVSYDSDLEKVEKVLLEISHQYSKILKEPKPKVRFREFANSAISLELLVTIAKPHQRGEVIHELIKRIQQKFKKEGITIPFPQRDIHLHKPGKE